MVAPHVDYQCCYEAAKIGLASGNELVSFPCPECRAVCSDPVELTSKLQTQHGCIVCASTSGPSIHLCKGILWLCWDAN